MSFVVLKKSKRLKTALLRKWAKDGAERGGFILPSGRLVEFKNVADEPEKGYIPDVNEAFHFVTDAVGTWHTHPGASAALSSEDAETFIEWPEWIHAVVGADGLRWYEIKNHAVINA